MRTQALQNGHQRIFINIYTYMEINLCSQVSEDMGSDLSVESEEIQTFLLTPPQGGPSWLNDNDNGKINRFHDKLSPCPVGWAEF